MSKKKKREKAQKKKFNKYYESFKSFMNSKPKKKSFDKWDDDDDDYEYSSKLPEVIPEIPIPVAFEKRLTNNAQDIREGNSVPEDMILDPLKDGGFHFGRKKGWNHNHYVGKR